MIKTRLNNMLFTLLITAFLTAQWSSPHIHLGEHHTHDGVHHQHASKGHSHHPVDHHADLIDSAHSSVTFKVVELDHQFTLPIGKKIDDLPDVIFPVTHPIWFSTPYAGIRQPDPGDNLLPRPPFSKARIRAPPPALVS